MTTGRTYDRENGADRAVLERFAANGIEVSSDDRFVTVCLSSRWARPLLMTDQDAKRLQVLDVERRLALASIALGKAQAAYDVTYVEYRTLVPDGGIDWD